MNVDKTVPVFPALEQRQGIGTKIGMGSLKQNYEPHSSWRHLELSEGNLI